MEETSINLVTGRPRFKWRSRTGPSGTTWRVSLLVETARGFASWEACITPVPPDAVNLTSSEHGACDHMYRSDTQAKSAAGKRADAWFVSQMAKTADNDRS